MNLAGLRKDAERRLRRIERDDALDALAGNTRRLDTRRFRCLQSIPIAAYLQAGDVLEVKRLLLADENNWKPAPTGKWLTEWTVVTVDRVGDCVRFWVPRRGSVPIPTGDFVRAVLHGHAREPRVDGEKLPVAAVR